jgi:hypothetical protein
MVKVVYFKSLLKGFRFKIDKSLSSSLVEKKNEKVEEEEEIYLCHKRKEMRLFCFVYIFAYEFTHLNLGLF